MSFDFGFVIYGFIFILYNKVFKNRWNLWNLQKIFCLCVNIFEFIFFIRLCKLKLYCLGIIFSIYLYWIVF